MIRFAETIRIEELERGLEVNPMVFPNLVYLNRKRLERNATMYNHRQATQLMSTGSSEACKLIRPELQCRCGLELSRLYIILGEVQQAVLCANFSLATAVLSFEKADALTAHAIALQQLSWSSSVREDILRRALIDVEEALRLDVTCVGAHRVRALLMYDKYAKDLVSGSMPLIGAPDVGTSGECSADQAFIESLEVSDTVIKNRPPFPQLVGIDVFEDSLTLYDLHTATAFSHNALASLFTTNRDYHASAARDAFKLGNSYLNAAQRESAPTLGVEATCMAMRITGYATKMKSVFNKPSLWNALHSNPSWHATITPSMQTSPPPIFMLGGRSCGGEALIASLNAVSSIHPTYGIEITASGEEGLASGSSSVFGMVANDILGRISASLARGDTMTELLEVVAAERQMVTSLLKERATRHATVELANHDRVLDFGEDLWMHVGKLLSLVCFFLIALRTHML